MMMGSLRTVEFFDARLSLRDMEPGAADGSDHLDRHRLLEAFIFVLVDILLMLPY